MLFYKVPEKKQKDKIFLCVFALAMWQEKITLKIFFCTFWNYTMGS